MAGSIFFDLDGTLSDPKPGITRSIQYALAGLGHAVPSEDALAWCIGPPLRASFTTLLGSDDSQLCERAITLYRERFADLGLYENAVYPGIADLLTALQGGGYRLFVATSKPHLYANRILAHFGLAPHFERVFGAELDGTRSDKRDLLGHALDVTGIDAAQATMIGDRKHDIIGARHHAMRAIGVLYGYGSAAELKDAGAHDLCATPGSILEALSNGLGSRVNDQ